MNPRSPKARAGWSDAQVGRFAKNWPDGPARDVARELLKARRALKRAGFKMLVVGGMLLTGSPIEEIKKVHDAATRDTCRATARALGRVPRSGRKGKK